MPRTSSRRSRGECACAYCTYSGIYPQERTHLPLKMDAARIADAVQLIRESARQSPDAEVVFYSDEPLTNPIAVLGFMDALTDTGNDGTRFHFQRRDRGVSPPRVPSRRPRHLSGADAPTVRAFRGGTDPR